jgi:hypothetical protein
MFSEYVFIYLYISTLFSGNLKVLLSSGYIYIYLLIYVYISTLFSGNLKFFCPYIYIIYLKTFAYCADFIASNFEIIS